MNYLICVFCGNVYDDVMVCPACNEYKGLMPLVDAVAQYGFNPHDYANYLDLD